MEKRRKVLYISDSLGTPIPHRGIFNSSVAMVERLKKSGADVTLLVERPDGRGVGKHWLESDSALEKAMDPWQNAEVFKYLDSGLFAFSLELNEHVAFAANEAAHYSVVKFLERHKVDHFDTHIRNIDNEFYLSRDDKIETEAKRLKKHARLGFLAKYFDELGHPYHSKATPVQSDIISRENEYLRMFDGFLTINCIYSQALTRAHNFIPPYRVECSYYDEVIVDGPHYISLVNNNSEKTSLIFYDLIPLKNSSLSEESHRSFSQKLFASLALDANMIFISESSQTEFHQCFPGRKLRSERVIYPPIRNVLSQIDLLAPEANRYLLAIGHQKKLEQLGLGTNGTKTSQNIRRIRSLLKLGKRMQEWNPSLPYFVTVLSDEPYKNAALCVRAFQRLEQEANLLIVGRMDASKYISKPTSPNIHFTGFLPDKLKNELIANSTGLVFPSFYEGFGIPVLEGALQGVPVLCSSIEVFREIVDDNSLFFDPHDADELVARVLQTLSDPAAAKARAIAAQAFVREKFMLETVL